MLKQSTVFTKPNDSIMCVNSAKERRKKQSSYDASHNKYKLTHECFGTHRLETQTIKLPVHVHAVLIFYFGLPFMLNVLLLFFEHFYTNKSVRPLYILRSSLPINSMNYLVCLFFSHFPSDCCCYHSKCVCEHENLISL